MVLTVSTLNKTASLGQHFDTAGDCRRGRCIHQVCQTGYEKEEEEEEILTVRVLKLNPVDFNVNPDKNFAIYFMIH